jgi:predicted dehydrogenase
MGIYPLTVAHLLLGEAEELTATAALNEDGIDLDVAIAGRYPGGAVATMAASMTSWSSRRAELGTDAGRLVLEEFHHPTQATYTPMLVGGTNDFAGHGTPLRIDGAEPVLGRGFAHEIAEVGRCLSAGLLESPLVPHAQTLTIMRQLDAVRGQCGIHYEGDG